jgi:ketosteroid isomerase-like protein
MSLPKSILPLLLAGIALAPAAAAAQAETPAVPGAAETADAPVRAAVAELVNALNAFDAARVGRSFAEDATIFFPGPPFPAVRVQGRATIQGAFNQLFIALRQRGTRGGSMRPQGLEVQLYGDTAVATFLIGGQQEIGRRTLVLRRIAGRWLVAHMHGSSAPPLQRPAAGTPAPAQRPAPAPTPAPPRR